MEHLSGSYGTFRWLLGKIWVVLIEHLSGSYGTVYVIVREHSGGSQRKCL